MAFSRALEAGGRRRSVSRPGSTVSCHGSSESVKGEALNHASPLHPKTFLSTPEHSC
jgi:hypothetical protein